MGVTKVQFFYTLFGAGFSETLFNTDTDSKIIQNDIPAYLDARLACATKDLQCTYVRVADAGPPRRVSFVDLTQAGRFGTFNGTSAPADDALLVRLNLASILSLGASRFWMHGIPGQFVQGSVYVPSASFQAKLTGFGGALGGAAGNWRWNTARAHTIADRQYIQAITPLTHRGFTIQPNTGSVLPPAPGSVIYVGGEGASLVGVNGRKVVTSIAGGLAPTFNVGGSVPLGTYVAGSAYYYNLLFELAPLIFPGGFVPVRLADHDVGRPFGLPRGRRPNLLSLRR